MEATSTVQGIKRIFASGDAFLFVDTNDHLWVAGKNKHHSLGVSADSPIVEPLSIGISLEKGEEVVRFYKFKRLAAIYTSLRRLFISRVVKPSVFGLSIEGNEEEDGVYYDDLLDSNGSDLTPDYWPQQPNIAFTSAYVSSLVTPNTVLTEPTVPELEPLELSQQASFSSSVPDSDSESEDDEEENGCEDGEREDEVPCHRPAISNQDRRNFMGAGDEEFSDGANHTFGLPASDSSVYYDNCVLAYKTGNKLSVVLANTASFAPPILNVDEVAFASEAVFFRRGSTHCVYSWSITPNKIMYQGLSLASKPIQHESVLTYYQLRLPFKPDAIKYHKNFVYARSGNVHHILSSLLAKSPMPGLITWIYFEMGDIGPDNVFVSAYNATVLVQKGNTVLEYSHAVDDLRPIIQDRKNWVYCATDSREPYAMCLGPDGSLIDCYIGLAICGPDPWLEHVHGDNNKLPHEKPVIVAVKCNDPRAHKICGDALLINIHNYTAYHFFGGVQVMCNDGTVLHFYTMITIKDNPTFKLIETLEGSVTTYYHYRWLGLPLPLTYIYTDNNVIFIRSGTDLYRSAVTDDIPQKLVLVNLKHTPPIPIKVDHKLVLHQKVHSRAQVGIRVESHGDLFESLCAAAEMFGVKTRLIIKYTRKGQTTSHGDGITRTFIQDAVAQFASTYLTQLDGLTLFNLPAWRVLSPPQIFRIGRALHAAICNSRAPLPTRLPIGVCVAILGRRLTIEECEYLIHELKPEVYASVVKYRWDTRGLKDCGYASYEDCLHALLSYPDADTETDQYVSLISRILADGFKSYMDIPNFSKMAMPTLDYYLSGSYSIDRKLLLGKIKSAASLDGFIKEIIQTLPSEKLAVLLRNWSGSVVVSDVNYSVVETQDGRIFFSTCSRTLSLDPKLLRKSSFIPRAVLIDMLTTPVTHVRD